VNEAGELAIGEIKLAYRIPAAWRDLQLDGAPGKSACSPFRHDRNPSFSIYADGRKWKDHGTNEQGDVIDFVARAMDTDTAGALRWIRQRLGFVDCRSNGTGKGRKPRIGELRDGSPEELVALNVARGFAIEGLKLAEARGFLRFCTYFKQTAWCVTDRRRELFEFRRLDGKPWPAYKHLAERKAHCVGAGKCWPLGVLEAEGFAKCALVEGAPDFVGTFNFLLAEGKEETVAPLAMLGAANEVIDPEALKLLAGRCVRLYPHQDPHGQRAARSWARQLLKVDCKIDALDLEGCVRTDGVAGKDLADLLQCDPDCWQKLQKFHEVLP
jgi:CHC2 zinc finger